MRILNRALLGVSSAAILSSTGAGATVLDLSLLPLGPFTDTVTIGDYQLTQQPQSAARSHEMVNGVDVIVGTDALTTDATYLNRADGGVFTLTSVDVGLTTGDSYVFLYSPKRRLDLYDVATSTLQTLTLGSDFADVTQVIFASYQGVYFANFDVTAVPEVGSVPEPGTWSLMLLGFGGFGAALRSDRAKKARAQA